MANNTNAQAIAFSNTRVRTVANLLVTAYLSAKAFMQQWTAQSIAAVIPNDANPMDDGSLNDGTYPGQPVKGDGRANITDAQINIIFAQCQTIVNLFEGATGAPVNNGSFQNYNQCLAVAPQGGSIF
jgi:hypothetical protein